jgi:hypothetical protein
LMLDEGADYHSKWIFVFIFTLIVFLILLISPPLGFLVPNSNSCTSRNTEMYNHYSTVRSWLAIPQGDLLSMNAARSGQFCSDFGIYPNLEFE